MRWHRRSVALFLGILAILAGSWFAGPGLITGNSTDGVAQLGVEMGTPFIGVGILAGASAASYLWRARRR